MKRFGLLATLALSLATFAGSAKADLVIDSFAAGSVFLPRDTVGSANSTLTGLTGNVIGGTRNLTLNVTGNGQPGVTRALDTVNITTQRFSISNDDGVDSNSVLLYDANGAGLGGIDLGLFGNQIAFNVLSIDTSVSITVDLVNGSGTATQTLSNLSAGTAVFNFSSFTNSAIARSVNAIRITFNTPQAADLSGTLLRVTGTPVPEPSSVVALGMGALMMGGFAVRRRRAAKA